MLLASALHQVWLHKKQDAKVLELHLTDQSMKY